MFKNLKQIAFELGDALRFVTIMTFVIFATLTNALFKLTLGLFK